jgi:hypothetical protein
LDNALFEPDSVLILRLQLAANNLTRSGGTLASTNPFAHFADAHYQTFGPGTKNKVPNFYT